MLLPGSSTHSNFSNLDGVEFLRQPLQSRMITPPTRSPQTIPLASNAAEHSPDATGRPATHGDGERIRWKKFLWSLFVCLVRFLLPLGIIPVGLALAYKWRVSDPSHLVQADRCTSRWLSMGGPGFILTLPGKLHFGDSSRVQIPLAVLQVLTQDCLVSYTTSTSSRFSTGIVLVSLMIDLPPLHIPVYDTLFFSSIVHRHLGFVPPFEHWLHIFFSLYSPLLRFYCFPSQSRRTPPYIPWLRIHTIIIIYIYYESARQISSKKITH